MGEYKITMSLMSKSFLVGVLVLFGAWKSDASRSLASYVSPGANAAFLNSLQDAPANSIQNIAIRNTRLFRNINDKQVEYLGRIVNRMWDGGAMPQILRTVRGMFEQTTTPVEFSNFLFLSEFVMQYHEEKIQSIIRRRRRNGDRRRYNDIIGEVRQEAATAIGNEFQTILGTFNQIRTSIENSNIRVNPPFENIYTMVYHYYKHRVDPANGNVLGVDEYLGLVQAALNNIRTDINNLPIGQTLVRNIQFPGYGHTFRIVVKRRPQGLVTSSGFFNDRP